MELFLQMKYSFREQQPALPIRQHRKALEDGIKVTSSGRHIADGTLLGNEVINDPLEDLYWTNRCRCSSATGKFVTTPSTGLFEVTADVDSVIYDGNNQIRLLP